MEPGILPPSPTTELGYYGSARRLNKLSVEAPAASPVPPLRLHRNGVSYLRVSALDLSSRIGGPSNSNRIGTVVDVVLDR